MATAYTLHQPAVFQAKGSIALSEPAQYQPAGTLATPSPEQYVESQVVLLQSDAVGQQAAVLGNAALHAKVFSEGDFTGPASTLKLTSQAATNPTTSIVDITFDAPTSARAATGVNAVIAAYNSVRAANIRQTDDAVINGIDAAVKGIDAQLSSPVPHGALDTQLAASLVAQRATLLAQRAEAVIAQQVDSSQTASAISAFQPSKAVNHKITKIIPLGAVIGFVLGTCLAYGVDARRRSRAVTVPSCGGGVPVGTREWMRQDCAGSDGDEVQAAQNGSVRSGGLHT